MIMGSGIKIEKPKKPTTALLIVSNSGIQLNTQVNKNQKHYTTKHVNEFRANTPGKGAFFLSMDH